MIFPVYKDMEQIFYMLFEDIICKIKVSKKCNGTFKIFVK